MSVPPSVCESDDSGHKAVVIYKLAMALIQKGVSLVASTDANSTPHDFQSHGQRPRQKIGERVARLMCEEWIFYPIKRHETLVYLPGLNLNCRCPPALRCASFASTCDWMLAKVMAKLHFCLPARANNICIGRFSYQLILWAAVALKTLSPTP